MAYRRRHRGTTTQRGYGASHVHVLKADIARWRPGDPCAQCGRPMWHRWMINRAGKRVSAIHLGHTPDRTGYIGLCHAYCNTAEGAIRGNRMRGVQASGWAQSRRW